MITLDGSQGEGGGQILRSALALSLVTGRPFRITRIRARRPKPGLMRQHLACVEAAARLGSATVDGATLHSTELTFQPGAVAPGSYAFKIGGAGSTMLLLHTVLPPLLLADGPSEVVLEGGTHNPFAPPFPFIEAAFLPLLRRLGFAVEAVLERPGFNPNGGGRCRVRIMPAGGAWRRLDLPARTAEPAVSATIWLAGLAPGIAEREAAVLRQRLGLAADRVTVVAPAEATGPGNSVHVHAELDGHAEVFSSFGSLGRRAEAVVAQAADEAGAFLRSRAAVGAHLADQLLLPLALAAGGSFSTAAPTEHTRTNLEIIGRFLGPVGSAEPVAEGVWQIHIEGRKSSS